MKKTNIKVLKTVNDGQMMWIEFADGKQYKLQHPGNRIKLQWEKEFINPVTGIDMEKFLDLCFENCVIPESHKFKPTIDNVKPAELGVWGSVLRRFLGGELNDPLARPEDGTDTGGASGGSTGGDKE